MKKLILIAIMVIGTTMVHAGGFNPGGNTPGTGGGGGNVPPVGSPGGGGGAAVPFDGGLSLILLAAGAGVGAKRKKLGLHKD